MPLKESGEMYLETIYVLSQTKPAVRSIDIADHMHFSKPSVSRAVGLLKKQGYITVDQEGHICLSPEGLATAKSIYERHTVLTRLLKSLGVDDETAAEDACRMEHVVSPTTVQAMKRYLQKLESNE